MERAPVAAERESGPGAGLKSKIKRERWGLALLACAVGFNAWFVAPEARISRVPLNDVVFHLTASERLEASIARGEPFLDPWVSEWALGYPVWRSYQPLPHAVGALLLWAFHAAGDPAAIFAAFLYFLIATFPVSVYVGARLLGLPPPAAGLAALAVYGVSAEGDLDRYGLGYDAYVWRGSGLFTQLFALHLLAPALGLAGRALDAGGRARQAGASLMLALTSLSHIIFGYGAFVSAAVLAVVGPGAGRRQRLVRLAVIAGSALLLLAWFLIPMALSKEIVNHSRWEDQQKWDSYGAGMILRAVFSGTMFDWGRAPWLSGLLAVGIAGAAMAYRKPVAQRLMALTGVWLALFFGRATWGGLVALAAVPADMPMHRFQALFELSAILLAAYGLWELGERLAKWKRGAAVALGVVVGAAVVGMGIDRAGYLEQNKQWGEENLAAYARERGELEKAFDAVRAIEAERPGRVSAGLAATWGKDFKIGSVPVFAFLSMAHFDEASFLYHSMSKPGDVMVARDENSRGQDIVFGIRAVVAPADKPMPGYMVKRWAQGRFAVYEASPEGYFGVVEIGGHAAGGAEEYETSAAWLTSELQPWGIVISLDGRAPMGPAIGPGDALPAPLPEEMEQHGRVLSESKVGERYEAKIEANQPAYAFVKVTWAPDWKASVDGRAAEVIRVTPGFCAVAIPAGEHEVVMRYEPGRLKPILLVTGVVLWGLVWVWRREKTRGAAGNAGRSAMGR